MITARWRDATLSFSDIALSLSTPAMVVDGPPARLGRRGSPAVIVRASTSYSTGHAGTAPDGRDGADPWGYRAALTSLGTATMCPMAGKLGPRNGMDWTSGSSTFLPALPRVLPYSARRTAHLITGLAVSVSVTGQAS